jgi:nitrogen fixation NifU-like protein
MNSDMYREVIMDLYKNPMNFGLMNNPSNEAEKINPICGDKLKVQLKVEDGVVREAMFSGVGCVISIAAASLITEKISGMKISDIMELDETDISKLMGINIVPIRIKCALLSLEAIKKALNETKN